MAVIVRSGLRAIACISALAISACGTYVPTYTEFWGSDEVDVGTKISNIAAQTRCELRQALKIAYDANAEARSKGYTDKDLSWLDNWGAELELTLNVREKSDLTPAASFIDPLQSATTRFSNGTSIVTPQQFSLNFTGELSSEATRVGIVHMSFLVSDVKKDKVLGTTCLPVQKAEGFLFIESNLGLKTWLIGALNPATQGIADYPARKTGPIGQDAISQQIKFEIVSSGGISPFWRLVRVNANTSPNLFQATRDRFQNILITIGPTDKAPDGSRSLSPIARSQFQAQQFGAAVANALPTR